MLNARIRTFTGLVSVSFCVAWCGGIVNKVLMVEDGAASAILGRSAGAGDGETERRSEMMGNSLNTRTPTLRYIFL